MRIDDIQRLSQSLIAPLSSSFMRYPYKARVYNSANISINNTTGTAITFNSERYDTGAFHSTSSNTSRLTVPVAGYYLIGANIWYDINTTGLRETILMADGTTYLASDSRVPVSGMSTRVSLVTLVYLTAAQYVETRVYQTSGGALNVIAYANASPEMWIVGPL